MFKRAELLYRAVPAVVVGQKQPLVGNQLARTSAAEKHYGIFERSLVDAVNVFGRKAESLAAHILYAGPYEARQPHAFVRRRGKAHGHGQCKE